MECALQIQQINPTDYALEHALQILYSKIKMTDSKKVSNWMAKNDRRSGVDRRKFSYTFYIPERRCGKDRRSGKSTARSYLLNIEDDGAMKAQKSA
jgi:hypothetical protein